MQKGYLKYNLPGWNGKEDDVFECTLKAPSILDLATKGEIPNPLIGPVVSLFRGELEEDMTTVEGLKRVKELTEFFCEVCLIEPKYSEVRDVLTDHQKMNIYFFATRGVKALIPFLAE
ncbi:TPA: hypothetical protein ACOTG0_002103 [Clostridium perfringens]|nr:hypothetical protein phiCPD_00016 [Clostridium phage phiCp-D]